jgi:hypothetical protein
MKEHVTLSASSAETEFNVLTAYDWGEMTNPYEIALVIYGVRVDELRLEGLLPRPSDIATKAELDDHFAELSRLYRQTCLELGLVWPPPFSDEGLQRGTEV